MTRPLPAVLAAALVAGFGVAGAEPQPPAASGGWVGEGIEVVAATPGNPGHDGNGRPEPIPGTTKVRRMYEERDRTCTFDATRVRVDVWDIASTRRLRRESYSYCGTLRRPPPVESAPAAPAATVPLSPEEIWGLLPIDPPPVAISPRVKGLVGFETWLWYEGESELRLPQPLTLGEWQIDVDAKVVHYRWDMGDGGAVEGDRRGADGEPTDTYAYQYPCTCQVTATVTWAGSYTVTGPGFGPVTIDLGIREFTGPPLDYPVREVQAVIVD